MSRIDILNIPTAEEIAIAHVRECYYRLVRGIAENIDYSASRGNTSVLESIPIDFLEAIVRTFISKGYEVECLGEAWSDKGTKEEIKISWEGLYE